MNVAELRQEYMRAGLSEADADRDPVRQFEHWLEDALRARLPLPNAATLATVSEAGTPAARAVLLKGIERGGFVFYTNYRSRKGRELDARAAACLVFLWPDLERQVRIEGSVEKLSAEESDAYFATRPLGARLSAWASAQSERVPDRAALEAAMEEARKRHGERPPRPPHWGGYRVTPQSIEFWQGRADRLHDRLLYTRGGGVSSDIWRVELASGPVCVKCALPRLRVAQVWEAPVERSRYEYEWFRIAAAAVPGAVPQVIAQEGGMLAMQYLDPARHPVWKDLLREGHADAGFASKVGRSLAAIHSATANQEEVARRFATDDIFYAIRLEPYLVATAAAHPDLEANLLGLLARTAITKLCLVHGDVSPKNILVGPHGPVFLDAECAWYGDPAFDLAFCLNHLLLKCLWVPQAKSAFLNSFAALRGGYLERMSYEDPKSLEARTAALLPALLLARVDGKSPVEYLTGGKDLVRRVARAMLAQPPATLGEIQKAWQESSM